MAQKKKETVYLRKRLRSNGTYALYLDMCRNGKRVYEYLKLYLIPELTRGDKQRNRETLKLAEAIRAKRVVEVQAREFGVSMGEHGQVCFLEVMRRIMERKEGTTRTSWGNCMAHVLRYEPNEGITFGEITPQWVQGFRDYLDRRATVWGVDSRKRNVRPAPLSQGTKALMFQKFCAVFNVAMREGIIRFNPTGGVERFKEPEGEREFLTMEEVRRLYRTPPPNEELGRAFFFACLTGLRWSDIVKLRWSEVQGWHEGTRIVFTQKKTGDWSTWT